MADRGVLFHAPLVRALLAGTKTQTRRTTQAEGERLFCRSCGRGEKEWRRGEHLNCSGIIQWTESDLPRFRVGDRLWVREAWRVGQKWDETAPRDLPAKTMSVMCEAGGSIANQKWGWAPDAEWPRQGERPSFAGRLRASMHMPRWASRLTLTVTDVRVERLQDISTRDARAEGFEPQASFIHPKDWYAALWNSINGAGAWEANPWVAAYTFTVRHGNVDEPAP